MKNLPLAALMLGALVAVAGTSALAADLPLKAPIVAGPFDWTGFYGGANLGLGFGRTLDTVTAPPGTPFSSTPGTFNGTAAGLQGGYNWQAGWVVLGVETDIQWANLISNNTSSNGVFNLNDQETLEWFGTGRGRIGITPAPGWLVYGTGGAVYGVVRSDLSPALINNFSFINTRFGWTAGAGVEAAITTLHTGTWAARFEFLYMDFGTWSNTFPGIGATTPMVISVHPTDFIVRLGLSYRFAPWSAPLLAKD